MVGQTKSTLDIREAMDEGHIILANLSGSSSVYDKDADLFGRLLTRLFLFHAKRRKNTRPFNMILDECQRYLSGDIPTLLAEVRKYAVPVLLSHQWLAQLETESANMLAAVMGGTNCKICFRIKDAEEAEQLAHSIIPLDLERPVGALIKPTVIGHKRATLNSKSYSKQAAETESQAKTTGISTGIAITDGETVAETSATYESTSKSSASSYADISGSGQGASSTEIMVPTGDQNNPLETRAVTSGANESANVAHSDALSSGVVTSSGTLHSSSFAQTHAETRSRSQTEADTIGKSRTRGNNLTVGISESLEPMLRWLPSAVHGKENMLYMAAQALRNLKTGVAYLNYVGPNGMVSTLFKVPEIAPSTLSAEAFNSIRSKALATSSAALATNQALSLISDRHAELSARCRREPTPEAPTRARGKKRW
jgi:hypothetical protein